jgi:predicted DNA-binding transcriptional regulator YafY
MPTTGRILSEDGNVRNDRLLSILLLLQAHGRLSARDLAARLETSVRTIYRDIDALSAAGVPVYSERGRRGGAALLPGFSTDVTGLTPAEAEAIFVAAGRGGLAGLGLEDELALGLRKLMAALPARQRPQAQKARDRVIVEPARWLRTPEETPWLETVRAAVIDEVRLRLRYRPDGAQAARERVVDPYGLVSKGGTWYLIAAPVESGRDGEPRLYRVSRIEEATALSEPARRPVGLDVERVWQTLRRRFEEERGPGFAVRLAVVQERLEMLLRLSASQIVGPALVDDIADEQGRRVVTLPFVAEGAAEGLLLGFGTDVEVLQPAAFRARLATTARLILALYAEPPDAGPRRRPATRREGAAPPGPPD